MPKKEGQPLDEEKKKIAEQFDFHIIGLSVGVPLINGKKPEKRKYKVNKRKWFEIFGIEDIEDLDESDETIQKD